MDGQGSDSSTGVLRQLLHARNRNKAEHGRVPQLPLLPEQTPAQSAATAIGRAAETLYQLPLQTQAIILNGVSLAEIPELLPDGSLLIILQGRDDEMGVMALCREAVAALIEMQTCARVTSRPVPKRKLTRGDALMCAEFANTLLKELATELGGVDGYSEWGGFRYATFLDDPRPLELILEDKLFRSLNCQLGFGQNQARQGTIFVALPSGAAHPNIPKEPESITIPKRQPSPPIIETSAGQPGAPTLRANVQEVPVDVYAILCRRKITLGELRSLKNGALISLPRVSLTGVTLELQSGHVLAGGKLGEAEGYQAIRLHDPDLVVQEASDQTLALPDIAGGGDTPVQKTGTALPVDLEAPNEFLMGSADIEELDLAPIPMVDSA